MTEYKDYNRYGS